MLSRLGRLSEDETLLELVVAQANERLASSLPSLERELSAARECLSRRQAENRALVSRLIGMPPDTVPQSFWDIAKEKEAEITATREEIQRLERKQEDLEAARLSADDFKGALQNLTLVYRQLKPIEQSRLLACLIDRIVLDDEKATMWLMGEKGQLVKPSAESSPRGQTSSPGWVVERTTAVVVGAGRRRKARPVSERRHDPRGPERWRVWRMLLETGAVSSKAELARAMGVSRAAVTMGLAKLEATSRG